MFLPLYGEASFEEGKTACVLITNTQKIVASLLSKRQAVFISSEEAHYNMMDKMSEIIKCKRCFFFLRYMKYWKRCWFLQASPPFPSTQFLVI